MARSVNDTASARQAKYGATAGVYVLIVVAVLVAINWLANRYNKTYDATANKRFTLSDQTQKIVKDLKGDATITYFDRGNQFDQAKGMLDRYANLSSKIHVKYVDILKDPITARAYNLRETGTAFVETNGKREEAKGMTEEGLTGAFIHAIKGGTKKICFVQGSGEHNLDESGNEGLSRFKDALTKENYTATAVSLLQAASIPSDCTVLVSAGPRYDYPQPQVDAIKKYVEDGGRLFIMLDPPLQMGRTNISRNDALDAMLAGWGVTVNHDLVLETNPIGQMVGIGPEVPLITSYGSQTIVNDIRSATGFPLAQSLTIESKNNATVEKLFSTSDRAESTTNLAGSSVTLGDAKNKKGPFTLGAAGTFKSGKSGKDGRFVVIGNSGFASSFITFNANRDLALNAVNWLAEDEDLISIRPKEAEDRRLNVNSAQMRVFLYFTLIAFPLLLIGGGVMVFLKRR